MPYVPEPLPLGGFDAGAIIVAAGRANASRVGTTGSYKVSSIPKCCSRLLEREAVLSSRIEGTRATVEDVLGHEAGVAIDDQGIVQDIGEVLNYRVAMRTGGAEDATRPIRLNTILQLHSILLNSVRGHDKQLGEFRREQNWIGPRGSTIDTATFVPPSPLRLQDHLEAFEVYLAGDDGDALVQCAIMHAQFELLHPFIDGNGRIGRVLVPLFLCKKGKLSSPSFYLSEYLERNRDEYCARLQAISRDGDWTEWLTFF